MKKSYFFLLFDFLIFIYNNKTFNVMKKTQKEKIKISVTISKELLEYIDENAYNRSAYIEHILKYYYNHLGVDVSKIKL